MTTRTLESRLVINAQDKTAEALNGVVKHVDGASKSIENFRKVQARFADARRKFQEAQKTVEGMARAVASVEKPARAMEVAYKGAQRAVTQASRAFEAEKSAVLGAKRELEGMGVVVTRLASEQNRLKTASEQAAGALERQGRIAARAQKFRAGAGGVVAGGLGLYGGHLAHQGYSSAVKATAEGAHERVRMDVAGMEPHEVEEAEQLSARLTKEFSSVGQTKILHLLRNARSIVGNFDEAGKIIEPLLQTYVVAQGAHPEHSQELAEDFDKLVKGLEIKGVTQDMPKFQRYLNGMSKALNVFGDTLRPTDYYEMFKYGRQSTQGFSEKFMLQTAPTLAQELGGSGAGKAMSSFYQAIVGGRLKQAAIVELQKYGMIDPSKVVKTKTGATKGILPGGVMGWQKASADPYAWINEDLLPALAKKGVTDPEQIQQILAVMFQAGTAAQMASIFATQQSRIEKDWHLVEHAKGSEAHRDFLSKDPYVAMTSVTEQFMNLLQAAGSPLAQPAADGLNAIARGLVALSEAARDHPTAASGGLMATLAGGALAGFYGTVGVLGKFGVLAPETAARWGMAPLIGAIPATAMLGGATLSYKAANRVWENPAAFRFSDDNGMLGALGGEYDFAARMAEQANKKPDEMKITVEVQPADGFWTRVTSLFSRGDTTRSVTTTGSTGKTMPDASPQWPLP